MFLRYRQTEAQSYGLTIEEMLNATDQELNQWVSLKEVTQYGQDEYMNNKFWSNEKKFRKRKKKF